MNAAAQARRSGLQLQLALIIGAIAAVLIHLSLTYAVLGELDRRLIALDGGIAVVGLAIAFWYVGTLVEERQRHHLETVLIEVLTVPRDIADTAHETLAVLRREGLADAGVIAVADDTDSAMHPIAAIGYPDGWTRSAQPERLPDPSERPSFVREREPHRWVAPVTERIARQPWVARMPLFSGDDCIGLLLLATAKQNVLRDHRLLETLSIQLSAALDHAAMYEAAYQRERDLEEQDYRRLEVMAAASDEFVTAPPAPEPVEAEAEADTDALAVAGITGEELEEHIESPIQGVDRLNVLIDDLMDLGRTGFEYTVEPEEVDLVDVVRRMADNLRPAMAQRELTLIDEMPRRPLVAVTDPMLVEKVILNVLSNATRHAEQGGEVTLYARRTGDGRGRIEIHDDGARIDPEDRERIFEPYYRVRRPEAAPVPGSGLGLAVARRVTETLGGVIWVDERDDPGARICIEIPGVLPFLPAAADASAEGEHADTTEAEPEAEAVAETEDVALPSAAFASIPEEADADEEEDEDLEMPWPADIVPSAPAEPAPIPGTFASALQPPKPQYIPDEDESEFQLLQVPTLPYNPDPQPSVSLNEPPPLSSSFDPADAPAFTDEDAPGFEDDDFDGAGDLREPAQYASFDDDEPPPPPFEEEAPAESLRSRFEPSDRS